MNCSRQKVLLFEFFQKNSCLKVKLNVCVFYSFSRGFIFPEAFRLTLVKGIVRIKNIELRPLIKARERKEKSFLIGRKVSTNYEAIRPTGSLRQRMYGLPKTHKKDIPLRPILSMVGSSQHQLAKWLTSVLDSVLSLYSTYCISDSFTFVDTLRNSGLSPPSVFLCSFDVSSLFLMSPSQRLLKSAQTLCTTVFSHLLPSRVIFLLN